MFPPTPEQEAILSHVAASNSNLMIRAFAGCGKTSTLELIDRASPINPKLFLCFNKSIATEAKTRMQPSTTVKTFNGLGHSIWKDVVGKKLSLNGKKILELFRTHVEESPRSERTLLWSRWDLIKQGIEFARALGYIPPTHAKANKSLCTFTDVAKHLDEPPSEEVRSLINLLLIRSIGLAYEGVVDFNDQIYMPALFAGVYPEFPLVLIDEYQDLSPTNQAMVAKLCKRSRQIGVGDEAQAIYGFRGADADSMPSAISRFNMDVLPLSLTFRCPSKIVDNVHWRVPEFRAFKQGGRIDYTFTERVEEIEDNSAVICRNNAPLLSLAMKLLLLGRKPDVAGVDMASRVITTLTKLGPETLSQSQTLSAIDDWEAEHSESKTSSDMADSLRIFATQGSSLGSALLYARTLFASSSGTIQFMTGHKAKGLEFDHVYHLDRHLLKRRGQDSNIEYVIDSRPKNRLTYLDSAQFERNK